MTCRRSDGFTLIEIVLVIALISLVAGAGLRLPYLFEPMRQADADMFVVQAALYRAEMLAASGEADSPWGVLVSGESATIFQGESYDQRVDALDIVMPLEADPVIAGSNEIVFMPMSGVPTTPASLSVAFSAQTTHVSVNANGVIDITITQ